MSKAPKIKADIGSLNGINEILTPPETAEDHTIVALEKVGLRAVLKILRDWHGLKEINRNLSALEHRDPVDRFTHAKRHAVALYAREHGLIPTNLMVEIVGVNNRKDPKGSEREKLRKAAKYLEEDKSALAGAEALANHWKQERPSGKGHAAHLKQFFPKDKN
jgi:hypothetical protein